MSRAPRRWLRALLPGRIVSAGGLLVGAALIAGVFVVCHLAG